MQDHLVKDYLLWPMGPDRKKVIPATSAKPRSGLPESRLPGCTGIQGNGGVFRCEALELHMPPIHVVFTESGGSKQRDPGFLVQGCDSVQEAGVFSAADDEVLLPLKTPYLFIQVLESFLQHRGQGCFRGFQNRRMSWRGALPACTCRSAQAAGVPFRVEPIVTVRARRRFE